MTTQPVPTGPRPPQQARSRAALQKILASAEQVLAAQGFEDFTMATVAQHAGVSIGAMYRRFVGREQLLDAVKDRILSQLEMDVTEALASASGQGIIVVIDVYTKTLGRAFSSESKVLPEILSHQGPESAERGKVCIERLHKNFMDAASPHAGEIHRAEPEEALEVIERTIIATCIHRTISLSLGHDPDSWEYWAAKMADIAISYLTTPDRPIPSNDGS